MKQINERIEYLEKKETEIRKRFGELPNKDSGKNRILTIRDNYRELIEVVEELEALKEIRKANRSLF